VRAEHAQRRLAEPESHTWRPAAMEVPERRKNGTPLFSARFRLGPQRQHVSVSAQARRPGWSGTTVWPRTHVPGIDRPQRLETLLMYSRCLADSATGGHRHGTRAPGTVA